MAGTAAGGRRARNANIEKYGPDFYKRIGIKGGSAPKTRPSGFATLSKEEVRRLGAIGGKLGSRSKTITNAQKKAAERKAVIEANFKLLQEKHDNAISTN